MEQQKCLLENSWIETSFESFHLCNTLPVHLENQQRVLFSENSSFSDIAEQYQHTMLTEWMNQNLVDQEARRYLYVEFPEHYVWVKDGGRRRWRKRVNGKDTIGRVAFVHPTAGERFYLRLLLHNVRGATSFQNLRTVNGEICDSFQSACQKLGLTEDNNELFLCFAECVLTASPTQLRQLFATMLINCTLYEPIRL